MYYNFAMMERKYWGSENFPPKEKLQKQVYSSLISGAAGDAFGMPIEGWNRRQIEKYIGELRDMVDPQEFYLKIYSTKNIGDDFPHRFATRGLAKGNYTDDTFTTLMVGNGIVKGAGFSLKDIASEHIRISNELELNKKDTWDSFGRTTTGAIKNLANGVSPRESGVASPMPGNGPAIKMGPVGIRMFLANKYDEGLGFAEKVGKMTHLHTASVASGIAQAHGVWAMMTGLSKEAFLTSMADVVRIYENKAGGAKEMTHQLDWIANNQNASIGEAYRKFGSTFSALSNYPLTIFMVQKYWDRPFEGLIKTVNMGGDSDSTGAMYGTLMGAKHGIFTPESWVSSIQNKEPLIQLSQDLVNLK